jgi:hypothetical protein
MADSDPDKWYIGWDWFAQMWWVDPPLGCPDQDQKWFTDRADAFEYMDEWLRKQDVEFEGLDFTAAPDQPRLHALMNEPDDFRSYAKLVMNPVAAQDFTERNERLNHYKTRVGLQT